nr:MAG TPA: hypothetical protein [Caudoviricetes sp.]
MNITAIMLCRFIIIEKIQCLKTRFVFSYWYPICFSILRICYRY